METEHESAKVLTVLGKGTVIATSSIISGCPLPRDAEKMSDDSEVNPTCSTNRPVDLPLAPFSSADDDDVVGG